MGLDCYFVRTDASPEQVIFPKYLLRVGGVFFRDRVGVAFRGEVYEGAFQAITGKTLSNNLTPGQVEEAAESLLTWIVSRGEDVICGIEVGEICDLFELFDAAAAQKMALFAHY